MTMIRQGLAVLAMTVALAGCATSPTPSTSPSTSTAPTASTAPSVSTSAATPATTAATPAVSTTAVTTPAAPANVDTVSEKAAWEALLSPDGEYAAHAAYQSVIDKYGRVEPYVTIQTAEQQHIDALARQLERTGVTVPANPYLGTIPAPASLKEAALAGAERERANIALYDRLITQAPDDSRLPEVFDNLRRASQDTHLPLFEAAAAKDGTLTVDEMHALQR